jgi:hypothetical protein
MGSSLTPLRADRGRQRDLILRDFAPSDSLCSIRDLQQLRGLLADAHEIVQHMMRLGELPEL